MHPARSSVATVYGAMLVLMHSSLGVSLCIAVALVVLVVSLHALVSSTALLHQDSGTYDAGIVVATLSPIAWDADAYYLFVVLVVHELLVVGVCPS